MKEQTVVVARPVVIGVPRLAGTGLGPSLPGPNGQSDPLCCCILGLYVMGMVMGEGKIVYWRWVNPFNNPEKFCIYYLGQFWVGLPALPALDPGDVAALRPRPDSGGLPGRAVADRLERTASSTRQAGRDRHDLHDRRGTAQHPGDLRRVRRARLPGVRRRSMQAASLSSSALAAAGELKAEGSVS